VAKKAVASRAAAAGRIREEGGKRGIS